MPICTDEGELAPGAFLVLRATMLYPRDGEEFARFAAGFVDGALYGLTEEAQREALRTNPDLLDQIIELPELGQEANRRSVIAEGFARHASLAGQILTWLVIARTDHTHLKVTIEAAISAVSDRVLTAEEIRSLWTALDQEHPVMAATFRMRLMTAQRGSEVLAMRWEHIDGDWWTIPAELAKNGLAHRVPLAPQVQALLDELRPITGHSEWVFASPRRQGAHITAVQKAAGRIAKRADVEFVPHDLRRTAASHMTSMGISRLVVSKILNHVESGITAVYDRHSYDAEKRESFCRWDEKLSEICEHPVQCQASHPR